MIYLQKSKKKSKKILISGVGILFFLVIAGFLITKAPGPLSQSMRFVGEPLWRVKVFLSDNTHFVTDFFSSKNTLVSENDALKAELDQNRENLLEFQALKDEHDKLLADYGRDVIAKKILATVLVRPPETPYDEVVLDIGSSNGIVVGDKVYSTGDIALGTITDVSAHTSSATLFSRTDVMTDAIFERSNLAVTMHGIGGGSFEVEVPQEADVMKDDVVIVPALEPTVVGVAALVQSSVTSAFKRVLIQSPTNISYTRFVIVEPKN